LFIHSHIEKKNEDVKSDRNCGFCIVAEYLGHGEDSCRLIRLTLLRELSMHKSDYMSNIEL